MTREQLEHAIRAVCEVTGETDLRVFGSQSILGQFPDAPAALRTSMEVDIDLAHHPDRLDLIDGTLGEGSQFHETHGFYVEGVSIETAILPTGWDKRTVRVENANTRCRAGYGTGHCLEVHDLAASKLAAWRPKDLEFLRTLLQERLVDQALLIKRIRTLALDAQRRSQLSQWVQHTASELRQGG